MSYHPARDDSDYISSFATPEVRLFRGVVTQAFFDAFDGSTFYVQTRARKSKRAPHSREAVIRETDRAKARIWFERNSLDFQATCNNADLDPAFVRRRAMELMNTAEVNAA